MNQVDVVVFRKWKNGDLIALFPELPADIHGRYCDAYEHVGQHGGADYFGVIQQTKPCSLDDAADLITELRLPRRSRCSRCGKPTRYLIASSVIPHS
jgi:hypothetical protein